MQLAFSRFARRTARAVQGAHNALMDLEELSDGDLERIRAHYAALARRARADLGRGLLDTGTPDA